MMSSLALSLAKLAIQYGICLEKQIELAKFFDIPYAPRNRLPTATEFYKIATRTPTHLSCVHAFYGLDIYPLSELDEKELQSWMIDFCDYPTVATSYYILAPENINSQNFLQSRRK